MSIHNVFSTLIVRWVVAPSLAVILGAVLVVAQSTSAHYTFLVGAGFLCDSGDSSACPAVVKSADGASYEMTGAGMLTSQSKTVTAAGTFTHKSPDGVVLDTGVWIANELVSFDSSGIAPNALRREGRTLGPPQFGPMRMGVLSGSMPAGGRAVLRIRLLPVSGFARNATLQVNCALGNVPAEHQTEGIRLAFERSGVEYDEEISGRALFLLTRTAITVAAKPPAPEAETNPVPTEGLEQPRD